MKATTMIATTAIMTTTGIASNTPSLTIGTTAWELPTVRLLQTDRGDDHFAQPDTGESC